MDLYLHIGTEKTGTTTTQKWLSRNRQALRKQGIFYPESWGDPNCRRVAVAARDADKPDDGFFAFRLTTPEAHAAFVERCKTKFADECIEARKQNARAMVISGEHMHSTLTNEEMVARVPGLFGDGFSRVIVVIHLRPQVDVAVSLASTAAKGGYRVKARRFDSVLANHPYYAYDDLVRRWENVFGAENVMLVPFRKQPSMVDWLSTQLDINHEGLVAPERSNVALGIEVIALANAAHMAGVTDRNLSRLRNMYLEELPQSDRLNIGLARAEKIQARFDEDNARLANRRNDIQFEDFQPDWHRYEGAANLGKIAQKVPIYTEALREMIIRFNAEIFLERGIGQIYLALYHLEEGNHALAMQTIRHSRRLLIWASDAEHVRERAQSQLEECQRHLELIRAKVSKDS